MSDYTLFHLPLPRPAIKPQASIINSQNPQLVLHASTPSSEFSFYAEGSTPPTPLYDTHSYNHRDPANFECTNQSNLLDPFEQLFRPSFQEDRYSADHYLETKLLEMASPSKNNFARQAPAVVQDEEEDIDETIIPSPVVEYDLTDTGYFAEAKNDARNLSNTHRRNKSGESSTSTSSKWWKLGRQRIHHKSASASTHPTLDRASSRSSSFTSVRGPDFDANSSSVSFSRNSNWAVETSPPVSPPLDSFTFPKPNHPASQGSHTVRKSISRDGFVKSDASRAFHSKQSSLSSTGHSRQKSAQSMDAPLNMASSQDKWSLALGHANYTVEPEPYTPDQFDLESWRQLLVDREAAHADYCKQRIRIIEHYGLNTKQFKLTEAKWAEVNTEWEHTIRMAKKCLMAQGVQPALLAATTASQNVRMPALNPHVDGKFPKLGDEDIVGPMAQSEPIYSSREPSPARKSAVAKWKLDKLFGKSGNQN